MFDDQAAYLVGQAWGHLRVGQQQAPRATRQLDSQQATERAGRLVGRAFQLYMQSGLTKEQAVARIVSLAQIFGSLE